MDIWNLGYLLTAGHPPTPGGYMAFMRSIGSPDNIPEYVFKEHSVPLILSQEKNSYLYLNLESLIMKGDKK